MIQWKTEMLNILQLANGVIEWSDIGNKILQNMYINNPTIYKNYKLFDGLNNVYPVNWDNCVSEYIEKPHDNYKSIIREYQPFIILVNSVYKVLANKTETEIMDGNTPLNYFINKSTAQCGPLKKYVIITDWVVDYLSREPYAFAKNLETLGWTLVKLTDINIQSIKKDKCIVLCITYDDFDMSVLKCDNVYLIYRIDELHHPTNIRQSCVKSSNMIIGPYQYLFNDVVNFYPTIDKTYSSHITYSAVPEIYETIEFNVIPIDKILVTGIDDHVYPLRRFIKDSSVLNNYIEIFDKNSYTISMTNIIYSHLSRIIWYYWKPHFYSELLNKYICCFVDASYYKYTVSKIFDICSVGSLLLVDDSITNELNKLGFVDSVNCVMCNLINIEEKVRWIMCESNRPMVDTIRSNGMELVRNKHNTKNKANQFDTCVMQRPTKHNTIIANKQHNKYVFDNIYKKQIWNDGNESIPLSGPGSSLTNTKDCSAMLNDFIYSHDCKSVLDIGCGDLTWISQTTFFKDCDIKYTGVDIVDSLIKSHLIKYPENMFICTDVTTYDAFEFASVIILRDVIFHLTNEDILSIFTNIRNKFDYILITNCVNTVNTDVFNRWHFANKNIHHEPFNKSPCNMEVVLKEKAFNRNVYIYAHDNFYETIS